MYISIEHEVEISEIMCKISDTEIRNEYFERVKGKRPSNISLLESQNLDKIIQEMEKIDQFELETFLNKY